MLRPVAQMCGLGLLDGAFNYPYPLPVERGPTAWVVGLYTTHSTVHLGSGRIRAAMTLLQM
jgi:hypothetical protein